MKKSVVGEWAEGDAFGMTLRGWRALLTLNNSDDRACDGKERCPIRGPIGSALLGAPRIRFPSFLPMTGNESHSPRILPSIWTGSLHLVIGLVIGTVTVSPGTGSTLNVILCPPNEI